MVSSEDTGAQAGDPLRAFLQSVHLLTADRLPEVVAESGRALGAAETVIYLVDYEQARLLPLLTSTGPARQPMSVDGTVAGLAFRRVKVTRSSGSRGADGVKLWVPLLDGAERLGVLELTAASFTTGLEDEARALATLVAELVVTLDAYSDVFARLRRRRALTLAAEIQWDLLPPLTFAAPRVVITAALEPAYEIGGDTFDYAVNGDTVHLLVLDAMGHGLPAALLSSAAVGAYRHARRNAMDLTETSSQIGRVISEQFGPETFATAILASLDLTTGQLRWINAGHPEPLVLRDGRVVRPHDGEPQLPLGLQLDKPAAYEVALQPGDRVLLYTDGIVEARNPDGEFFGNHRLADFVLRSANAGYPPPETLRRLMREILAHQADQLQDDGSIVLLEWRTQDEQALTL